MDAVRDVRDGDVVGGHVAEQRPPHLAGDLGVPEADAVRLSREPERSGVMPGHSSLSGVRAAELEELLRSIPSRGGRSANASANDAVS